MQGINRTEWHADEADEADGTQMRGIKRMTADKKNMKNPSHLRAISVRSLIVNCPLSIVNW
jgi:hypothetical protein